jgi:hypothetical protein
LVKQSEVEHTVRMRDFEAWLESNGRSPAEMALIRAANLQPGDANYAFDVTESGVRKSLTHQHRRSEGVGRAQKCILHSVD